jgi:hypothetical protein
MATLQHSETGARIEVPDEPGVEEHYAARGWVPVDGETDGRDPAFGTYDGDDYKDEDDAKGKSAKAGKSSDKS